MARAFTRGRSEAHPPLHRLRPAFGVHRLSRSHPGPVSYRIHLTWPAGASAAAEGNGPVPGAAQQWRRSEYGRVPVADARQAGLRPARDHTPAIHGPRRCKHTAGPRSSQPLRVAARAGVSPAPPPPVPTPPVAAGPAPARALGRGSRPPRGPGRRLRVKQANARRLRSGRRDSPRGGPGLRLERCPKPASGRPGAACSPLASAVSVAEPLRTPAAALRSLPNNAGPGGSVTRSARYG
jgi:hypothetical protein